MGTCTVCAEQPYIPDAEIADHLRLLHPDEYGDGPDWWPDGTPVIYDMTVEPHEWEMP